MGNFCWDDWEADLEPEFVAQEDSDALTITTFEGELEDMFQEVPELLSALISYVEARGSLRKRQRFRAFWSVGSGKGNSGKGKFSSKSAGIGKKGRDREGSLAEDCREQLQDLWPGRPWESRMPPQSCQSEPA